MATKNLYTNLLGYDPYERQLQDRKLWAGLYGSASSPYEKMGLGLAQLGGTLFGALTEDEEKNPVKQLTKLSEEASKQFAPESAEYYKYIAENATNPMIKQNAGQYALAADEKASKKTREDIEFLSKHPDQLATELQYYQARLERQARTLGWNPQDPTTAEVPPEIMAKLEKSPDYKKIMQLSNAGQQAMIDKAQKEEKEAVSLEAAKLGITKTKQDLELGAVKLQEAGKDKNTAMQWFIQEGLDPTKPLIPQIQNKPEYAMYGLSKILDLQQKALKGETPKSIAPPKEDPMMKAAVEKTGQAYRPDLYEYRIVGGKVQRAPR